MKKIVLFIAFSGLLFTAFSQTPTTTGTKKNPTLALSFFLNDFQSAQNIRNTSLSNVISQGNFSEFREMSPGIALSYMNGLSSHVDFVGTLGGSFVKYPFENRAEATSDRFLMEASGNVNLKLFADNYILNPYLTAGVGVSYYQPYFGAFIPVGSGFQVNLGSETFLLTQVNYKFGISDNTANLLSFSLGFAAPLTGN